MPEQKTSIASGKNFNNRLLRELTSLEITAILVAALTFIGYLISYSYEIGVYEYFNLPLPLMKVEVEYVLSSTITLATVLSAIFIYFPLVKPKKFINIKNNKSFLTLAAVLLLIAEIVLVLLLPFIQLHNVILKRCIIGACILWIPYLGISVKNMHSKIGSIITPYFEHVILLGYILVVIAFAGIAGLIYASSKQTYLTYTDKANNFYVIPRIINDKMIAVQVDKKTKCIKNNIKFLSFDERYQLKLEFVNYLNWVNNTNICHSLFSLKPSI